MTIIQSGDPARQVPLNSLEPGDSFRSDNLDGTWMYGYLVFKNASRCRAVVVGQSKLVVWDRADEHTSFSATGDREMNFPLSMAVERLEDEQPVPPPVPKAIGGPKMTDAKADPKVAGLLARYAHQHKQLNIALAAGNTDKAEVAQKRIDALEAEAKAAKVELPVYDDAEPAAAPTPVTKAQKDDAEAAKRAIAKAKEAKSKPAGEKKAPKEKKLKKTHNCLCGCGAETLSLYAPGHDARVKGILLKVERGDLEKSAIPETVIPFVKFVGKWKTEGFKLTAAPVKVPGRDEIENTSLKALEALDV